MEQDICQYPQVVTYGNDLELKNSRSNSACFKPSAKDISSTTWNWESIFCPGESPQSTVYLFSLGAGALEIRWESGNYHHCECGMLCYASAIIIGRTTERDIHQWCLFTPNQPTYCPNKVNSDINLKRWALVNFVSQVNQVNIENNLHAFVSNKARSK